MKKVYLILILIFIFTLTACSQNNNESDQGNDSNTENQGSVNEDTKLTEVRVVLDWTPNTNHTGLYVAQAKGFFETEGLEVEIMQPPEGGAETLVASGGAEFGISFQDYMTFALASEEPMPITAVATIIQHNTSGIISLKETGIDSPEKMSNHNYATWDLPIEQAIIKKVVEDHGGNFDEIEMIPSTVADVITALQTEIDSVWVYYAWDGIATEVNNLETNFLRFADYGKELDFYNPIIISNNQYMEENPEAVRKFLKAVKEGYEYAISNPDDAADILVNAAPELDSELVKASQNWLVDQYKAEVEQWGYIEQSRWDAFYSWLYEEQLIDVAIPSGRGFTNEFLPE